MSAQLTQSSQEETEHFVNSFIIYKVDNSENNKVYIGTTTKSVEQRKADHIQKAKKGVGGYFQEAIGTYGPEAFEWVEIDTANNPNELAEMEKQYILKYDSRENGYNRDSGGGFQKHVYQYSVDDGALIATYDSLKNAANAVNASRKTISSTCLGQNRTCKGFYWSYTLTEPFVIQKDKRRKKVEQYDLLGSLIVTYKSVAEASRSTRISKTCISKCCRGERDKSGGFLWRYI